MRVLIIDRQALFRESLIWMLEEQTDIQVAGQAGSGIEGVEKTADLQLDVLLLENVLPDGPGYKKTLEDHHKNGNHGINGQLFEDERGEPAGTGLLPSTNPASLTSRELEILNYVGNGATNQEIADLLGISLSTVKVRIRSIFSKLGLKNWREARRFIVSLDQGQETTG